MDGSRLAIAQWQFTVSWGLATRYHLPRLTDELCLWQPQPDSWTVRRDVTGRWRADWSEPEPLNSPPPSVAWLTWHVVWWWSDALAVLRGGEPAPREDVDWPGSADAVVRTLHELAESWTAGVAEADLDRAVPYPWADARRLIYLVSWVNLELMKNVAEIGEIANLYENRQS